MRLLHLPFDDSVYGEGSPCPGRGSCLQPSLAEAAGNHPLVIFSTLFPPQKPAPPSLSFPALKYTLPRLPPWSPSGSQELRLKKSSRPLHFAPPRRGATTRSDVREGLSRPPSPPLRAGRGGSAILGSPGRACGRGGGVSALRKCPRPLSRSRAKPERAEGCPPSPAPSLPRSMAGRLPACVVDCGTGWAPLTARCRRGGAAAAGDGGGGRAAAREGRAGRGSSALPSPLTPSAGGGEAPARSPGGRGGRARCPRRWGRGAGRWGSPAEGGRRSCGARCSELCRPAARSWPWFSGCAAHVIYSMLLLSVEGERKKRTPPPPVSKRRGTSLVLSKPLPAFRLLYLIRQFSVSNLKQIRFRNSSFYLAARQKVKRTGCRRCAAWSTALWGGSPGGSAPPAMRCVLGALRSCSTAWVLPGVTGLLAAALRKWKPRGSRSLQCGYMDRMFRLSPWRRLGSYWEEKYRCYGPSSSSLASAGGSETCLSVLVLVSLPASNGGSSWVNAA